MDENTSFDTARRQTINPLVDEINKQVEPLLKVAIKEFGYNLPLAFRLYNQIRFYEEYGKLKLGISVASKSTLAEQFGATEKQIDAAFNNLTNKYRLGLWVDHQEPIFRNVKRTWMSTARYEKGLNNYYAVTPDYYAVIPELLHGNSKTITAEELRPEVRPLSESKKKVSETISTNVLVEMRGIYDHYLARFNQTEGRFKLTDKRKLKLKARLRDSGKQRILDAIDNVADSSWHMGDNDRGWKADLDYIIRSEEQVERLSNLVKQNKEVVYDAGW